MSLTYDDSDGSSQGDPADWAEPAPGPLPPTYHRLRPGARPYYGSPAPSWMVLRDDYNFWNWRFIDPKQKAPREHYSSQMVVSKQGLADDTPLLCYREAPSFVLTPEVTTLEFLVWLLWWAMGCDDPKMGRSRMWQISWNLGQFWTDRPSTLSVAMKRQEGWSGPCRAVSATPPGLDGRRPFSE
jgi:hypothetical protein